MTVEQIRQKKAELEREILRLLTEFERETGATAHVEDVGTVRDAAGQAVKHVVQVRVEVE
jgi:hypothetical protein